MLFVTKYQRLIVRKVKSVRNERKAQVKGQKQFEFEHTLNLTRRHPSPGVGRLFKKFQ